MTVGENLGAPEERIHSGSAGTLSAEHIAPLNVLLAEAAPESPYCGTGIPDEAFLREKIPMTKQEIRAAALSKLGVKKTDVCWDIGAGTGSVSVELALHARAVWAVERNPSALELAQRNRERFCAWNLRLIEGCAPEALAALPKPDGVFVGGSGGHLPQILEAVCHTNPSARVCVSAISLETLHQAAETMDRLGYGVEITQISVSRAKAAGQLHLLMAQNPVFLITGSRS